MTLVSSICVTCVSSSPRWFHIHVCSVSPSSVQKPLLPEKEIGANLSRFLWKTWTWGRWRKKQSCFVVFSSEFLLSFLLSSRQRSRPRYRPPSRRWIPTEKIINIWGDFLNAVKSEFYRVRSVAEVPFLDMLLDWNVALYSSELSLLLEPFHLHEKGFVSVYL